jgi:glycosyltransferase involved in cell wall biosynthesis
VTTPRVSVLLPVRDAAGTLPECLASLAAQTLADYEVIAVDDRSADASRAILEAAARQDSRCASSTTRGRAWWRR